MEWKGEFDNQHLNLKKRQLFVNTYLNNEELFKELEIESQALENKLDYVEKEEVEIPLPIKLDNTRLALNLTLLKIAAIILSFIFTIIFLKKIHVI